jgi:hypothetical protein
VFEGRSYTRILLVEDDSIVGEVIALAYIAAIAKVFPVTRLIQK